MNVPKGKTEQEVIDLIQGIARLLAPKYMFGYFTQSDLEQEAFILGMECLSRYNEKYALSTFLYHHINNRLKTFKRDNYIRPYYICQHCKDSGEYCEYCEKREWRVSKKKNLMEPIDLDNVRSEKEVHMSVSDDVEFKIDLRELKKRIDVSLPIYLREDYLRMLDGVPVPKPKRDKIEEVIKEILNEVPKEEPEQNWPLDQS